MTVAEFFTGLRPELRDEWLTFFSRLALRDVTRQIAMRAGVFRYDLARQGRQLALADALIAATAAEFRTPLVTDNIKDFSWLEIKVIRPGTQVTGAATTAQRCGGP